LDISHEIFVFVTFYFCRVDISYSWRLRFDELGFYEKIGEGLPVPLAKTL
jgi:hypothetical protein